MLKKILISLFSSVFSAILIGIITLNVLDLTGYGQGDCGWVAVWLCCGFLPIVFFMPFIIGAVKKKTTLRDFAAFCAYSAGISFMIISVILLILVPIICS